VTVLCARRYFYEVFLGLHSITTAVAAIALWRHLSVGQFQARYYILGGIVFWGGGLLVGCLLDCRYNVNLGQGKWLPMANIVTVYQTEKDDQVVTTDACHLEIIVRRRWSVQPGEYLFICLRGLRFPYNFQRHPFWIVWWDEDSEKGMVHLDMLVRRRQGFTRRLLSHRETEFTARISRPFGRSEDFGDYGSVLMFATDVGIAAHLPYLKMLMQGRSEASIRTRHVVVVWQVEDSSKFSRR
jgi:predicted ferric reductase